MDTIQILNIDIPVKAYNIKKSEIQMKEVLLKEARKYLKNCSNYFASGILYPKTLEVLDYKPGIKSGSTLGDEMVFNTNVKGCFRLYPINTIHEGIITEINSVNIKINTEYFYNINIPLIKSTENILVVPEVRKDGQKSVENMKEVPEIENSKQYIYISSEVKYSDLNIGDTVQFQIVDLSSKFNSNSVSIIGYLIKKIDTYSKQYQTMNNTIIKENIYNNFNEDLSDFIKNNLPTYYTSQDIHYINTKMEYDNNYYVPSNNNKYTLHMTNDINDLNNLKAGDVICYFGNISDYNMFINKFASINIYKYYINGELNTIIIGSYYI